MASRLWSSLVVVAAVLVLGRAAQTAAAHDRYAFACRSRWYSPDDFATKPPMLSPDGHFAVQLTAPSSFRIASQGRGIGRLDFPDISANIEIGWSPDSSQFFISYSDGGAIGGYHVHLYRISGSKMIESPVPREIAARFARKHYCNARGNNLFFLDWTPDSKRVFLVTEVYPTSDCGEETSLFRGYEADARTGRVLHVFGEKETAAIEKSCRKTGVLDLNVQ